jgi:NADH-quinone oxidoreductase subunit N
MNSISAIDVARQSFMILLPEILLLITATAMMTAGAFVQLPRRAWCATAAVALGVALMVLIGLGERSPDIYSTPALNDAFSSYCRVIFLLSGLIVLALAHDQVDDGRAAEFFGALLFINAGAMLVAASNELVFLFVGLELVSIPTYLILYLPRRTKTTQEAATKYFFLSIFSSGLLLFGLAYLYGLTGVSNLKALAYLANHVVGVPQPQLGLLAVVFIVAGLGFRVAAVPFHFYAPDVYQGSPTVLAALLSWLPKAVGFMAMLRTVTAIVSAAPATSTLGHRAVLLAWLIAAITMTLGNTVALAQKNLRRLLAYSSIAHAGYLMIGIAVAFRNHQRSNLFATDVYFGAEAVLFYLSAYALMTLGAFGVIIMLSTPGHPVEEVDDLTGLGSTHPATALAMTICLLSLAGIPPLVGFWGKLELFAAAFAVPGDDSALFWWLGVIAVLNAAAGAFYYLNIVVTMYLRSPTNDAIVARPPWPTSVAVGACAIFTVLFGLYPTPITVATNRAAIAAIELPEPQDTSRPAVPVMPPTVAPAEPLKSAAVETR